MQSFIKSISVGAIGLLMAFMLLGVSVKAQSVEGTSWNRSAENGYYSETYTFYKNGKVKLFKVFKGKPSTRVGTYVQKKNILELAFPLINGEFERKSRYEIENDRLLLGNDNRRIAVEDDARFKLVKK